MFSWKVVSRVTLSVSMVLKGSILTIYSVTELEEFADYKKYFVFF